MKRETNQQTGSGEEEEITNEDFVKVAEVNLSDNARVSVRCQ
jgi:hypothetical protein